MKNSDDEMKLIKRKSEFCVIYSGNTPLDSESSFSIEESEKRKEDNNIEIEKCEYDSTNENGSSIKLIKINNNKKNNNDVNDNKKYYTSSVKEKKELIESYSTQSIFKGRRFNNQLMDINSNGFSYFLNGNEEKDKKKKNTLFLAFNDNVNDKDKDRAKNKERMPDNDKKENELKGYNKKLIISNSSNEIKYITRNHFDNDCFKIYNSNTDEQKNDEISFQNAFNSLKTKISHRKSLQQHKIIINKILSPQNSKDNIKNQNYSITKSINNLKLTLNSPTNIRLKSDYSNSNKGIIYPPNVI